MPAALSERSRRVLALMPPYYENDPFAHAVIEGVCANLDEVENLLIGLRDGAFPQNADDEYQTLSIWEARSGLPIQPFGQSIETRRAKVLGFQRRNVATGLGWQAALTAALGTSNWDHIEEPGVRITILIPQQAGGYDAATVVKLARAITPAHIEVTATYAQGFLLGISHIGDAL